MAKQPKPREPLPLANYRLYVLTNGQYLAAQELERKCGKIKVKDPALVHPAKTGLGFVFTPVLYVQNPILYEQAIMLEDALPLAILDSYVSFQQALDKERNNRSG